MKGVIVEQVSMQPVSGRMPGVAADSAQSTVHRAGKLGYCAHLPQQWSYTPRTGAFTHPAQLRAATYLSLADKTKSTNFNLDEQEFPD